MYDLILYDTSNYEDFPIGGQLTSIRNFLKYMAQEQKAVCSRVLLVGISTQKEQIGKIQKIHIDEVEFDFLPVLYRENDLHCVKKSLRLDFLKALIKKRKSIISGKKTVHYIHTPEAFIPVKLFHSSAKTVVFSHGNFLNMTAGFRFCQNNKLLKVLFNCFTIYLLKRADIVFALDEESTRQYLRYTKKVIRADNSIILPNEIKKRVRCKNPISLIFVGRLSKVKQIDKIIEAMKYLKGKARLDIVGDGEEYASLETLIKSKNLEEYVTLKGAISPEVVGQYMMRSDILLMNSAFEGKPMTILEALSYGLPVITTPVGGIPEMTEEGKNSEYTNGDSVQIAKAVFKIAANYSTYEECAFQASEKFDYRIVNEKIYVVLHDILQK